MYMIILVAPPDAFSSCTEFCTQYTHTSLFTPLHHTPPQVPLHLVPPSLCHPPVPGQLDEVGVLEISKEATVEELKITILTLPAVSHLTVM